MRRSAYRPVLYGGVCAGMVLSAGWGCLSFPGDGSPYIPVAADLRAEYVVHGADHPSALAFAADGRVFYTEKNSGQIRVIVDGKLLPEPFATVPVNSAGDRGLLGIALHPAFATNQRVYVFYTCSDTGQSTTDLRAVIDNRVVYFEANGNVAAGGEVFVVSLPADLGLTRVSGRLLFTRDGKLLVAIGDLTAEASAQDDGVLVGKILRYNDDGSIPDDNPLSGSPVYARGLRDVRGLCLDPDGTPVAVDRNERGHSEVNRVEPAKTYGWPNVVGKATTPAELEYVAANPTYVDPLLDAGMSDPALAGGSFNPSTRYGPNSWQHFFYGEAGDRRVIHGTLSPGHERTEVFATGFPSPITDVAFAPAGTLYVACTNAIFQIVPSK